MNAARQTSIVSMFLLFFLILQPAFLGAQVSLAAENKIDNLVIDIDGKKETFTVVRDFYDENQWYYIPDRPRLAMNGDLPQFHLIKYQTNDPKKAEQQIAGGVLQFAIRMSLPAMAIDKLKDAIASSLKQKFPGVKKFLGNFSSKIRLSAIPFNSSMVTVYDLENGLMMSDAPQQPGIAPTFATQEVPFQLSLSTLGTGVSETLTKKGGGIPVLVTFNYYALTPPCGFSIEVDWDSLYRHFSADGKERWKIKYAGYMQSDLSLQAKLVKDLIKTTKAIRVTAVSGEAFKDEDIDKFMIPVLTRINNEIFDNTRPPPIADPARIPEEPGQNWFQSIFKSDPMEDFERHVALKAVEFRRKGKETFEMTRQMIVERTSCCGGLIGIGHLNEEAQKELIEYIPTGNWASAYFNLPAVGDDANLGIKTISLTVSIVDKAGNALQGGPPMQSATWSEKTSNWQNRGETRSTLLFPLAYLYDKYPKKIEEFRFKTVANIVYKNGRINFTSLEPLFDGEQPVLAALDCVDVVRVYGKNMGFAGDEPSGELTMADITVSSKNPAQTVSGNFMGEAGEENPLLFLVAKESKDTPNPIELKINFQLKNGKTIAWKHNSEKDIRKIRPSLTFFLNRQDWEK